MIVVDLASWPLQQSMMIEQLETAENLLSAAASERDYFGRAQQTVSKNMPKYLLIALSNLNRGQIRTSFESRMSNREHTFIFYLIRAH